MTQYIAFNGPLSVTTALAVASTTSTSAVITMQLGIPAAQVITLVGYGISFGEDPTAAAALNNAQVELVSTATATTMGTAMANNTTVRGFSTTPDINRASTLTMTTAGCAYTAAGQAITSNTSLRYADRRFISPCSSYDVLWPSDCRPMFGSQAAAEFVQLRVINTATTCPTIAYIIWEEF